ncbi:MAG: hypothetical protein CGW95_13495 [Phenylobacterium zucineum]|nr:MAG: hypothetical protein CGW95_13495 [Phenylobacterium zucineum]
MRSALILLSLLVIFALGLFAWGRSAGSAAARSRLTTALAEAQAARLSLEAARTANRRIVAQTQISDRAADVAADVATDLSHSEIAHAPLPADRRDRLRGADQRLCQLSPKLDGCRAVH